MSDALISSYPNLRAKSQGHAGNAPSLYELGVASQMETQTEIQTGQGASQMITLSNQTSNLLFEGNLHHTDKTVAELAVRRLIKEINHAKTELKELEELLTYDLMSPPAREWLFPLMAIGLALSLYGSFSAGNTAELGATGLMLLWSLSAFWFIYTRDNRFEKTKQANKAEIEIWSSRILELEESLEQNQRIAETAGD